MLIQILFITYIFCAGILSGKRILLSLNDSVPYSICVALMLGLSMYVVLIVGSLGWLSPAFAWIWLVLYGLPGLDLIRRRGFKCDLTAIKMFDGWEKYQILCAVLVMGLCCVWFIASSAPTTEIDALIHQMALPKIWVQQGRIVEFPTNFHTYIPHAFNMLFAWGLAFGNEQLSGALFSFLAAILTALLLWRYLKDEHSLLAAFIGVIIYVGIPSVYHEAHVPLVDAGLVLYTLASIYAVCRYVNTHHNGWIWLAIFFSSLCAGIKFHGLVVPGLIVCLLLLQRFINPDNNKIENRRLLFVSVVAFICVLPWYLHTWVLTGNPIFPAVYNLLGGPWHWNETIDVILHDIDSSNHHRLGTGFLNFIMSPWRMTMESMEYGASLPFGPAILALFPLILLGLKGLWYNSIKYMLFAGLVFFTIMFLVGMHWARWFLPIFVLLIPPVSASTAEVFCSAKKMLIKTIIVVVVLGHFISGSALELLHAKKYVPMVMGFESKENFLRENIWYYDAFSYVNRTIPSSKILLATWYSGFYLNVPYLVGLPWAGGVVDYSRLPDAEALCVRLRELGVTHVLFDPSEFKDDRQTAQAKLVQRSGNLLLGLLGAHASFQKQFKELRYARRTTKTDPSIHTVELYRLNDTCL